MAPQSVPCCACCALQGATQPMQYLLFPITGLFGYPALWNNQFTSNQLTNAATAINNYIIACASGVTNLESCPVVPSNCASQVGTPRGMPVLAYCGCAATKWRCNFLMAHFASPGRSLGRHDLVHSVPGAAVLAWCMPAGWRPG